MTRIGIILITLSILSGCAAQAVPGGGNHLTWQAMPDGSAKVSFFGNKDTSVRNLKADMKAGIISVDSMDANGSNLGNLQMQWSIIESNNRRAVIADMMSMISSLVPLLGGGGPAGAALSGLGGGAVPVVETEAQKLQRAALVTKIEACPFLPAAQKASLVAWVKGISPVYLSQAQAVADSLTVQP